MKRQPSISRRRRTINRPRRRHATRAGQQLRLAGRGLSRPDAAAGNLYAIVQIVVPSVVDERERALYRQLAEISNFNPRAHFEAETVHEH